MERLCWCQEQSLNWDPQAHGASAFLVGFVWDLFNIKPACVGSPAREKALIPRRRVLPTGLRGTERVPVPCFGSLWARAELGQELPCGMRHQACTALILHDCSRVMGQESLAARGGFWDVREDRRQIGAVVLAAGSRHSSGRGRGAAAACI